MCEDYDYDICSYLRKAVVNVEKVFVSDSWQIPDMSIVCYDVCICVCISGCVCGLCVDVFV